MKQHFEHLLQENDKTIADLQRQTTKLSGLRFLCFVAAFIMLVVGLSDHYKWLAGLGAVLVLVFIGLVVWFQKKNQQLTYAKGRKQVLQRYIDRFGKEWRTFSDTGEQYLHTKEPLGYEEEAYDLDIFGNASLYQYMNISHSAYGQDALAALLVSQLGSEEQRQEVWNEPYQMPEYHLNQNRQEAVKELIEKETSALHLETIAILQQKKQEPKAFVSWDRNSKEKRNEIGIHMQNIVFAGSCLLLAITVIVCVLAMAGRIAFSYVGVMIFLQFFLSQIGDGWFIAKSQDTFSYLRILSDYESFFSALLQQEYNSTLLTAMQKRMGKDSVAAIKKLKSIGEGIQIRHNPIVYGILCGLCLYNAFLYIAFSKWERQYGDKVEEWLHITGKMEALLSLAVIGRVKEQYTFAEVDKEQSAKVSVKAMKHPLLQQEQVIANDCQLNQQLRVITGSNMSGKTTYLRTLGVNMVLAYAGAPSCAAQFSLSWMRIFTSMRVMDDVSQGISTFYAEVLRIKKMIFYARKKKPMLALIDEIFKGTNSADRIVGAQGVITALCKSWISAMVSTHDFELCSLAGQYPQITNYHFDEYFEGEQLLFDYTIKEGKCKTTNALHILKMAGICEEEIENDDK